MRKFKSESSRNKQLKERLYEPGYFSNITSSRAHLMVGFMVFNATFNNISWRSVLVMEKPEYPEKTTKSLMRGKVG